jgi:hypothetical protein
MKILYLTDGPSIAVTEIARYSQIECFQFGCVTKVPAELTLGH